jgi:hypothetical protein
MDHLEAGATTLGEPTERDEAAPAVQAQGPRVASVDLEVEPASGGTGLVEHTQQQVAPKAAPSKRRVNGERGEVGRGWKEPKRNHSDQNTRGLEDRDFEGRIKHDIEPNRFVPRLLGEAQEIELAQPLQVERSCFPPEE